MWKVKEGVNIYSLLAALTDDPESNIDYTNDYYRLRRDAWGAYIKVDRHTRVVTQSVSEGTVVGLYKQGFLE